MIDNNLIYSLVRALYDLPLIGGLQDDDIFDYLNGLILPSEFKITIAFISVILAAILVIIIIKLNLLVRRNISIADQISPPTPATESGSINARWEEIQRHINSTREAEWKFAIIEADKLVDSILIHAGFLGENMGERLINIDKTQLVTLDNLWAAHKVRNRLAHEPNYFLRYGEAKRVIELYKSTLDELKAI